jgi:hypothetical protein
MKYTRSYYRKESAASSPMDQSQHAQFAEYLRGCLYDPALPGRDMRQGDFDVLK